MEEYKGLKVPKILKPNELMVCNVGSNLDDDGILDCSFIDDCDYCVLNCDNEDTAKEYLRTLGKHTPLNECFNKENEMNISDNILTVFEDSATTAGKVAKRFGSEYGDTTRDRLALIRDKTDLLAIIKAEEKEAKKDK